MICFVLNSPPKLPLTPSQLFSTLSGLVGMCNSYLPASPSPSKCAMCIPEPDLTLELPKEHLGFPIVMSTLKSQNYGKLFR